MKRAMMFLFFVHLLAFPCAVWAQEETEVPWWILWGHPETGNDNPRGTTHLGMPITAPLSPTANNMSFGLGMSAGAGYNFDRRNALVGDFMWNWLYPSEQGIRPIQVALNTNKVNGHGNLFAFTGGYKLELRGRSLGTYFIVGGGWYYRTASLSKALPPGTPIGCSPAWLWWGYDCSTGAVVGNLTEVHSNSSALGANGGVGLTFRVGPAPYRIYVESRYHFAPTKNVTTQLITITWGIRY